MLREIEQFGEVRWLGEASPLLPMDLLLPGGNDIVVTPDNYDPAQPHKRPQGWQEVRHKTAERVFYLEINDISYISGTYASSDDERTRGA